jgi:flagellar protein FlaJ
VATFLVLGLFLLTFEVPLYIGLLFGIIIGFFSFYVLLSRPRYNGLRSAKFIETEIVSAIRFLILELKSEQSLYKTLVTTSDNFALIGIYIDEVIEEVKLGRTLEESLQKHVELCPSTHLRNVFWQLLNSLQTGADISASLQTLLDDVVDEQKIKVQEYGRELNALSLFYMMISIIIPTIGFTILFAALSFAGITITLGALIGLWVLLSLVQYMFNMVVSNRRPAVEAY